MGSSDTAARKPGAVQIAIMLSTVGVSVLVTAVLGPSLFLMEQHFADVEGAESLVPLNMTLPMLVMSAFSFVAGAISDRLGRKWLLVGAACLYAVVGTAPFYLDDLYFILASRVLLGVFEAFVMVIGIALIGDFFVGNKRARLLALQTTFASCSAFVLNNVGGYLGEIGWRAPYATYAFGFLIAIAAAVFLWEPDRSARQDETTQENLEPELRPKMIGLTVALAVLLGFVFLVTPVHLGYLFRDIGFSDQVWIGRAYGVNSLGVIGGTLLFGWLLSGRSRVGLQLLIGASLMAIGFLGMGSASDYSTLTLSAFMHGIGAGIMLPATVTWNMRLLPSKIRGFGAGAWQSGFFFGNFLAAIGVIVVAEWLGGARADAVVLFAYAMVLFALVAGLVWLIDRRVTSKSHPSEVRDSH